jgi:hypothetical protein
MTATIADEEWEKFAFEGFDTTELLHVVDSIDRLRDYFGDGPNGEPPELRTDALRLHQMAMDMCSIWTGETTSAPCSRLPPSWRNRSPSRSLG